MAFAFAYGSVSGGHMNPAVTVGVLAAGAMDPIDAIGYVASQLVGGIAGALLLRTLLGGVATGLGTPTLAHDLALAGVSLTITPFAGFIIEAVLVSSWSRSYSAQPLRGEPAISRRSRSE
jgi:aquaporin Z